MRTSPAQVSWPRPGVAEVAITPAAVWAAALDGGSDLAGKVRAGSLPIWVGPARAAGASTPARARVELVGRRSDALVLKVSRTDGVAQAGQVSLQVNYQGFRDTFGGDWAARLRLVRVSDGKQVPSRNNGSGTLTADVPAERSAGLYAVQAGPSSGAGDFKATSLSPTATWQAGGSSGDFTWSYPMVTPPGIGGPKPQLALGYTSGGVDGRTSSTNNQVSWVGQGFDLTPGGSIERRYATCGSKTEQTGNNGKRAVGDLCWAHDNATFALNGKGGELVRDDISKTWHPRNDDGTKVEKLFGTDNGDDGRTAQDKGEYWKLTSKDGTQYFFGLNKLPGATSQRTNSSWTVPVFGNHSGEQCFAPGDFAGSSCQQTYRWNLDYVVDRHGNTMSLFYDIETNNYARNGTATTVSPYTRAGNIRRIDYGQRDGQVFSTLPVARVQFVTGERCLTSGCAAADYLDTPLDQECTSTANCDNKFSPTFWTKKRLIKVTTEVARGSTFEPVNTWTMRQSFPDNGDGTKPGLWLEAISNAGRVGANPTALPEVNFDGIQLANRVDAVNDNIPPMNWWRVNGVRSGTGGSLAVTYSPPDCKTGDTPVEDDNGRRCHPMKWTPPGNTVERTDWFHKYVVNRVVETDDATNGTPVVTRVEYPRPPAWRFDEEDGLVEIDRKTWSQWRGYDQVLTIKGDPQDPQTVTEYRYFRGMDGDKKAAGGVKTAVVTDSTGVGVTDSDPLAGQLREQRSLAGSSTVNRTITDQWMSGATATRERPWGITRAVQIQEAGNRQSELLDGGAMRNTAAAHTYTASGALEAVSNLNDTTTSADDTCTRFEYAQNAAVGIAELPARKWTVPKACTLPWTTREMVADTRTYYDGSATPGGTPTEGNVTRTERLKEYLPNSDPVYQTIATATYDPIGRNLSITDAASKKTTTTYTPAGAGPLTRIETRHPNDLVESTDLEPAWGSVVARTDPGGRRTSVAYDALGRTSKVWQSGRPVSSTPSASYRYDLRDNGPTTVTTDSLRADGGTETTYTLFDGLQRPRQTQRAAIGGGRIITDHVYDSRGLEAKDNDQYYNDAPPIPDGLFLPDEAKLPAQRITTFDTTERPVTENFISENDLKWWTSYDNFADRQTIDPPTGEQATTKIRDTQGRLTELWQYKGDTTTGAFDKTSYSYTPLGQLASITDPAGNQWTFEYDLRGRKIRESDPDKGVTTYTYNDLDLVETSTDTRGTLTYKYDDIGRQTAILQGTTLRAEWTYDTVSPGLLSSTTRYAGGQPYTTRVTGYDEGGRPTGSEVVIPVTEGALAGTYAVSNTYHADGRLATSDLPIAGGLKAEKLSYGYNAENLPTTLSGASSYVTATSYTGFREPSVMTLAQTGGKWVQYKYEYETGTHKLARVVTDRETLPRRISSVAYNYDPAGNITSIADTPSSASGEQVDTQCFNYDEQRRLTSAWTPASNDCSTAPTASGLGGPAPYWQSWTFDAIGNRKTETRTTATGSVTSKYEYSATDKPHALRSVTTGSQVDSYAYGAAGDLKTRTVAGTGETFSWDVEGKLQQVTKAGRTTSYVYDADGDRLIGKDSAGATTLYLGDTELRLQGGTVTGTRYYQFAGQVVAVRKGDEVSWLGVDHHGTPNLAIDAKSQQYSKQRTTPYGQDRGPAGSMPGNRGFVGGSKDVSTGLVHLGAREYDPATGRFISIDPELNPDDPRELNSYSYANNSPVTFSDPDGKAWAIFSGLVKVARYVVQSKPVTTVVKVVKTVAVAIYDGVKNGLSALFNAIKAWIMKVIEFYKKVLSWIKQVIKWYVETAKTFYKWIADKIKDVVRKVVDKIKDVVRKIKEKLDPPQITPEDLTTAGNTKKPYDPRPGKDIEVDKDGNVHPTWPPTGKSAFKDINHPDVTLTGPMWTIPKGTQLPPGLRVIADGRDVGGSLPWGHHTIYPSRSMSYDEFVRLYNSLPWTYAGKKK